jgi:hypothetical protein
MRKRRLAFGKKALNVNRLLRRSMQLALCAYADFFSPFYDTSAPGRYSARKTSARPRQSGRYLRGDI